MQSDVLYFKKPVRQLELVSGDKSHELVSSRVNHTVPGYIAPGNNCRCFPGSSILLRVKRNKLQF